MAVELAVLVSVSDSFTADSGIMYESFTPETDSTVYPGTPMTSHWFVVKGEESC